MTRGRWLLRAVAVVPYVALCLPYAATIPMWDAREYTDCIEAAVRSPISLAVFSCAGHPTTAWTAIMSTLVWFAPDRFWPLLVASVALGVVGLLAFEDLVLALFPGRELEAAILTLCLGVFPVVVSGTVDINPDHGVLVLFVLVLRALLRGKPRQAGAIGLLLVFTKEPGVLLYAIAATLYAALFFTTLREKWREAWPLSVPPLAFGAYMLVVSIGGGDPLWHGGGAHVSLVKMFTTFHARQAFLAQILGIFVLQFAWIPTLLAIVRWARMPMRRPTPHALLFCDLLLLVGTFLLTRYQTFLNLRYYVAIFPLLLICGYAGLAQLSGRRVPRLAALGALAALFAVSAVRTVDPVSKAAMGTIQFGRHEMLDMTRATGECCGHGRDQIAYNLEHLHLARLEELVFADMHAQGARRQLVAAERADHHTIGRVEAFSLRRTLSVADSIVPRLWTASQVQAGPRPERLVFLRYFFVDGASEEARLRRWYRPIGERTFDDGGYVLTAVDYVLQGAAAAQK